MTVPQSARQTVQESTVCTGVHLEHETAKLQQHIGVQYINGLHHLRGVVESAVASLGGHDAVTALHMTCKSTLKRAGYCY